MRFWRNEWVAGHYQAVRTELIIAAKCSVHRSISGHCFSFALGECVTFGGSVRHASRTSERHFCLARH